jgi:hypothetical protein
LLQSAFPFLKSTSVEGSDYDKMLNFWVSSFHHNHHFCWLNLWMMLKFLVSCFTSNHDGGNHQVHGGWSLGPAAGGLLAKIRWW